VPAVSERRRQQVGDLLRDQISEIIQREMRDPRLGFVSITRVDVSPDVRFAKVYVSVYGDSDQQSDALVALTRATGFIRRQLGERVELRFIPEISFRLDRSMEHAEKVARLLSQVAQEERESQPGHPDAADGRSQ